MLDDDCFYIALFSALEQTWSLQTSSPLLIKQEHTKKIQYTVQPPYLKKKKKKNLVKGIKPGMNRLQQMFYHADKRNVL